MLNKSILLNLTIGKNEFVPAIITALAGSLLGSLMAVLNFFTVVPGTLVIAVSTIISLILVYKAMHLIFNKSLFDEGGRLFMTLPLSPMQMVLGKIIAVTAVGLLIGVLITVAALLPIILSEDSRDIVLEALPSLLVSKEALTSASPETAALLLGMVPLNITVQQFSSNGLFFAATLLCNLKKPGNASVLPWVIYFPAANLIAKLVEKAGELFFQSGDGIAASASSILIYLALSILFVFICCRILKKRYNY